MVGGYQILDLKNYNFTLARPAIVKDIYKLVEGTRKAILLADIQVGGKEYHDTFVDLNVVGSAYEGTLYGMKIKIENTDAVTFSNVAV